MSLSQREFGNKGFKVSILGLGTGHIGDQRFSESSAEYILNQALDSGITVFDTARAYGESENRIGKYLSHRRNEIIISTKIGYGIPGYQDWTYDCIIAGVDEALRLLRTDYIDIVHLHSCPLQILQQGDVVSALYRTHVQGKVRVPAYSGENEALEYAIYSEKLGAIQTSVNITDQRNLSTTIPKAKERGMGVISKRSIANALWKFNERPFGHYCEPYWERWMIMGIQTGIEPEELFIRFTAYAEGIDTSLIGTTSVEHLKKNIKEVMKGPLPDDIQELIKNSFATNDENWIGLI